MTESDRQERQPRRVRRYAAEFAVIFLGVSLSFAAENVREDRRDREAERESLSRLVRGMEGDLRDFQSNMETAERGAEAIAWIHAQGDGNSPSRDSLEHHLNELLLCSVMVANSSEYESLKSSGDLRVLRDLDFRQSLTALYEMYPMISEMHILDCVSREDALAPVMDALRIDPSGVFPRVRVMGDVEEVLSNRRFLNSLSMSHSIRTVLAGYNRLLISRLEGLRTRALELRADT